MNLADILTSPKAPQDHAGEVFALLVLGLIESLSRGQIAPTEAVQTFFSAENCLFVRKRLKLKSADRLMSHGVQLPDLFDILPAEEAHREFQHELETMRRLSLDLLGTSRNSRRKKAAQPSTAS